MVNGVGVTPDGRHVVSGSYDKTLRVWNLESGKCIGAYCVHLPVYLLTLALDGKSVCAGSGMGGEVLFLVTCQMEEYQHLKTDTSNEGYEQLLRRGLDFSRQEKGPEHEETLAHLTALAVHLEKMGKHDEARAFARERDELAARISTRKYIH